MKGKLDGTSLACRCPTGRSPTSSRMLEDPASVDEINAAFQAAATTGPLKGMLEYTDEPLVSADIVGNPHSCIFDAS